MSLDRSDSGDVSPGSLDRKAAIPLYMVYSTAMWQSDEYSSESKSLRFVRIEYHDPSETVTSLIQGAQSIYLFLVTRYGTDVRNK
jgi:hypothetical protein